MGALLKKALQWRLLVFVLVVATFNLVPAWHDTTWLLERPNWTSVDRVLFRTFGGFASWDGEHFLAIARDGYVAEKQHAFFPLLPMLMHGATSVVMRLQGSSVIVHRVPVLLGVGTVICNLAFLMSVLVFRRLSHTVLRNKEAAEKAALLYALTPAGVFMSAIYTESLFALCALSGMLFWSYAHVQQRSELWNFFAALCFCLATSLRSNGFLLAGFFVFSLIRPSKQLAWWQHALRLLSTTLRVLIVALPLVLVNFYTAYLHCECDVLQPLLGGKGDYKVCSDVYDASHYCVQTLPFPNAYGHIQRAYWNVGLLRYYTLQQLPQFALATPVLLLAALAVHTWVQTDWTRALTVTFREAKRSSARASPFEQTHVAPFVYLLAVMLLICLTVLHVQVSTRFLSFSPPLYWLVATRRSARLSKAFRLWAAVYTCVGSVLFASFHNWT